MRITVKARHMLLTPALKTTAEEKLGQAVARIFDRPETHMEIELVDLGHLEHCKDKECRVMLSMPRGKTIVISEVDEDMYKAIHLAHDRLLQQVKRERERSRDTSRERKLGARGKLVLAEQHAENMAHNTKDWEQEVQQYEMAKWASSF
jgi:ribosomal subunit interface protein